MRAFLQGDTDGQEWIARIAEKRGGVAFDVGANGGGVARTLAKNFDHVFAFEPAQESYQELLETPQNVTPVNIAISDHEGTVRLREAYGSIRTGQLVTGEFQPGWGATVGARSVPCHTLDWLVVEWGKPDLVKIDVEGHELQVLKGAPRLIGNGTTWMIEVHHESFMHTIEDLLWGYHLERVRHTGYHPDSEGDRNHFYIEAVPAWRR